ncbi:MAG: aspartyl/asparaginyl beta-hydroxylase domain-containing protein, partial [Acidimicrobiales bacterium]
GVDVRAKAVDVANHAGAGVLRSIENLVLRASEVPTTPFLSSGTFDWIPRLEAATATMQAELDSVLSNRADLPNFQDIATDQVSITDDDRWKTFFFFAYGFRSDANCARCPETARLLDSVPGMTTAFFSILGPRKHIPPHRGPWRGVLRYHLGLRVPGPEGACRIRVGPQTEHWHEGASLVFDDGYEHEAWNDTDDVRVVLFADVLRPLRAPAGGINRGLLKAIAYSPFVRDARARHEAWERRFEALANRAP